jgi:hypothetical protein
MKGLQILLLIFFLPLFAYSQTDELNQLKYWKLRHTFVEKFIKIGPNQGESLPAGSLIPKACIDNIATDGTDPAKWQKSDYGTMHWGDGMIRHGHYLSLLATEYALKKKYGLDYVGTLNELYYALEAINRLDRTAEVALNSVYGTTYTERLNGFFLREDIPEDFCLNWRKEKMNFKCTNSAFYENNNVAKMIDPDQSFYVKNITSYQNVPSMDQLSSIMLGLSMVHKLVDPVFVKPSSSDCGFDIIAEVQSIVDRMIGYVSSRNWEIIDANGWPVANGGGDIAFAAYPYVVAASRITGKPIDHYPSCFYRKTGKFHPKYFKIQKDITGYGTSGGPEVVVPKKDRVKTGFFHPFTRRIHKKLNDGATAGDLNNQDSSVYQSWILQGKGRSIFLTRKLWDNTLVNVLGSSIIHLQDQGAIEKKENGFLSKMPNYNKTITFNVGVTAGFWNSDIAHIMGNITENRELELVNAVLYDHSPTAPREFYKKYLDGMSMLGSYNMYGRNWVPNPEGPWYTQQQSAGNGWANEYRWTSTKAKAHGEEANEGVFNGIDYMLFHNLYYLLYADELPPLEEEPSCFCEETLRNDPPEGVQDEEIIESFQDLNSRLKYVPTCQPNVFRNVFNSIDGTFKVEPDFTKYSEWGIRTYKYQTMHAIVQPEGRVNVHSSLVVCENKKLHVESEGEIQTINGDLILKEGAELYINGTIRVGSNTTLVVNKGAQLILSKGAKLIFEDNSKIVLKTGGTIRFDNYSQIESSGNIELNLLGTILLQGHQVESILNGK